MCVLMSTTVDCVCCVGEQDFIAESLLTVCTVSANEYKECRVTASVQSEH